MFVLSDLYWHYGSVSSLKNTFISMFDIMYHFLGCKISHFSLEFFFYIVFRDTKNGFGHGIVPAIRLYKDRRYFTSKKFLNWLFFHGHFGKNMRKMCNFVLLIILVIFPHHVIFIKVVVHEKLEVFDTSTSWF